MARENEKPIREELTQGHKNSAPKRGQGKGKTALQATITSEERETCQGAEKAQSAAIPQAPEAFPEPGKPEEPKEPIILEAQEPDTADHQGEEKGETEGDKGGAKGESAAPVEPTTLEEAPITWDKQTAARRRFEVIRGDSTNIAQARERQLEERRAFCKQIFKEIAEGTTLQEICRRPDMPTLGTILRWSGEDAEIGRLYTQALQLRSAKMAEDLVRHCDELENTQNISSERVAALKVVINTKQWIMSRLLPKMYGDKTTIEHQGEVKVDEKQLDQRINALLAKLK